MHLIVKDPAITDDGPEALMDALDNGLNSVVAHWEPGKFNVVVTRYGFKGVTQLIRSFLPRATILQRVPK